MKRTAILIAGIMAVAGASRAQQAGTDSYDRSTGGYSASDSALSSTETTKRDVRGNVVAPAAGDPTTAAQHDPAAVGSYGSSISGSASGQEYEADSGAEFEINDRDGGTDYKDSEIRADSSIRGGSLEARGYDREANNDEIETAPNPINPGKQADSSIRGGSLYAREREWNHDAEPSSGSVDKQRHMKADSSIRGGSLEARGSREAQWNKTQSQAESDFDLRVESHDDFGQGSSATWQSDKADGSIRGSANWNPGDDLMRDGLGSESEAEVEINNDASVGGAVRSEVERGDATLDEQELQDGASGLRLNSGEELEENISGEYDLDDVNRGADFQSSGEFKTGTKDPNALDASDSSLSSQTTTDIWHDESDFNHVESEMTPDSAAIEMEAAGTAATSEAGGASSSSEQENSFQSNDPALRTFDHPTGAGEELNFEYSDNRAHGVGSLATGEFGSAVAEQSRSGAVGGMSDAELARQVKARLTRESTGTHGLMRHQVARNIEVTAKNGVVTLSGTAPSEQDKRFLEIRTAEMASVEGVINKISVTSEADPANRDLGLGHDLEDRTSELQD